MGNNDSITCGRPISLKQKKTHLTVTLSLAPPTIVDCNVLIKSPGLSMPGKGLVVIGQPYINRCAATQLHS